MLASFPRDPQFSENLEVAKWYGTCFVFYLRYRVKVDRREVRRD